MTWLLRFLNLLEPGKGQWVLSLTKTSLWIVTGLLMWETFWGAGLDGPLLGAYATVWLGYLGRRAAGVATGHPGGDLGQPHVEGAERKPFGFRV